MLELNKIHCMDCLEGLKMLEDNSIDITFTSPPFKEEDVEGDYWKFISQFLKEVDRTTKDYTFIFQSSTKVWDMCRKFRKPTHILMWLKPIMLGLQYKYEAIFLYNYETTSFSWFKELPHDVFPYAPKRGGRLHPYHNPMNLYLALIKHIPKDKIICDPFMGSGTTALACKQLNRNFIGFEINKDYVELANKRLIQRTVGDFCHYRENIIIAKSNKKYTLALI